MKTVSQARNDLLLAQQWYISAPHSLVSAAHDDLNSARHEYWNACADIVERLSAINSKDGLETKYNDALNVIRMELWQ